MNIKILGSGCKKCIVLTDNAEAAMQAEGIEATIERVTDVVEIGRYGIMSTPGLVVDDKVVSSGRMLSVSEIGGFLRGASSD